MPLQRGSVSQFGEVPEPKSRSLFLIGLSVEFGITRQREELHELLVSCDLVEKLARHVELAFRITPRAGACFDLLEFFIQHCAEQLFRNLAPVGQDTARLANPL